MALVLYQGAAVSNQGPVSAHEMPSQMKTAACKKSVSPTLVVLC